MTRSEPLARLIIDHWAAMMETGKIEDIDYYEKVFPLCEWVQVHTCYTNRYGLKGNWIVMVRWRDKELSATGFGWNTDEVPAPSTQDLLGFTVLVRNAARDAVVRTNKIMQRKERRRWTTTEAISTLTAHLTDA